MLAPAVAEDMDMVTVMAMVVVVETTVLAMVAMTVCLAAPTTRMTIANFPISS